MASVAIPCSRRALSGDRRRQADFAIRAAAPAAPRSPLLRRRSPQPEQASFIRCTSGAVACASPSQAARSTKRSSPSASLRTVDGNGRGFVFADGSRNYADVTPPGSCSNSVCAPPANSVCAPPANSISASPLVANRVLRATMGGHAAAAAASSANHSFLSAQGNAQTPVSRQRSPAQRPLSLSVAPGSLSPPRVIGGSRNRRSVDSDALVGLKPALAALRADLDAHVAPQPRAGSPSLLAAPAAAHRGPSGKSPVVVHRLGRHNVERSAARVLPAFEIARISPSASVEAPRAQQRAVKAVQTAGNAKPVTEEQGCAEAVTSEIIDVAPWLKAAQEFKMNSDFDLPGLAQQERYLDLKSLFDTMKEESEGKQTIQALADKIVLSQVLHNLDIPHLPNLLAVWDDVTHADVAELIDREMLNNPDSEDIVVKPTHLSSGAGVCSISKLQPHERDEVVDWLTQHMQEFMAQQAAAHESLALQSLRPGFIAQPCYKASVRFKLPLELRVVALWGQVRMGIWWWGRADANCDHPHRNVWIVRDPVKKDELSDQDDWKVIHGHTGQNPGFERAIDLFKRHMPTMMTHCERLASAVGAPFLRADFFVGSSKWGVRLNEVAYGCGCDYRNRSPHEPERIFDDAPAMAEILQEGMSLCQTRLPSTDFLSNIGIQGSGYADMTVANFGKPQVPPWPRGIDGEMEEDEVIIEEELCETPPRPAPPVHIAAPERMSKQITPPLHERHVTPNVLAVKQRGRSSEPRCDLADSIFANPISPRGQPLAPSHCNSSIEPSRSLLLQQRRCATPAHSGKLAENAVASVKLAQPQPNGAQQRTLVARPVSASKAREQSLQDRPRRIARAVLGG